MEIGLPGMIGFGIKTRKDFERAGQLADGAIIGTQFIRQLQPAVEDLGADLEGLVRGFLKEFAVGSRRQPAVGNRQ